MKSFLQKFKDFILYGGISKDEYEELREEIHKSNIKNTIVFSALGVIAYVFLYIVDSNSDILAVMKTIHTICLFSCFGVCVFTFVYSKTKLLFNIPTYLGIFVALALGAIIGIFVNGDAQTTTFMVFLFAIPLLFTIRPLAAFIVIFLSDLVYLILVIKLQTGVIKANNLSNGFIFGIVSICFSCYLMKIKIRSLNNAKNYKFLMENDQLTGLNNRLSFNSLLEQLEKNRGNCTLIEFDLNGLKETNDTKGHIAGDEIIVGAADCIKKTFSKYGYCFRVGGDEFVAVLDKPYGDEEKLMAEFERNCSGWEGKLSKSLSASYGLVKFNDYPNETLEEILSRADKLMYKNKSEYYIKSGKDRRRRS